MSSLEKNQPTPDDQREGVSLPPEEDVEGHRIALDAGEDDAAPADGPDGHRLVMADGGEDDTEGHRVMLSATDDEDDTEGHRIA